MSFGIDFGTTRSAVMEYDLIEKNYKKVGGEDPFRSEAAVNIETGECCYDADAHAKMSDEQYEFIPSLKELLYTNYDKVYGGVHVTSQSVIGGFFEYIKSKVAIDGKRLDEAVVAIPNDFPVERRVMLRAAALDAGIHVKFFVNEPVAAFYSNFSLQEGFGNGVSLRNCNNAVVFDWGGGTLDVTVFGCQGGRVYEISKQRMDYAGKAIDKRIAKCVHNLVMSQANRDIVFEDMPSSAQRKVLNLVEDLKIRLNSSESSRNSVKFIVANYGDLGFSTNVEVSRKYFDDCIDFIVNSAIQILKRTIKDSGLGIGGIDKIVFMGGSSKLLLLQQKVREEFGEDKVLIPEGNSDWGVAIGAAMLSANPGEFIVHQNVSLRLSDESKFPLIEKNAPVSAYTSGAQERFFGKVDASEKAVFVMTGSDDIDESANKYLVIKTQNFYDETLKINAYIDENMVVNIEGSCVGMPDEEPQLWQYANLSCSYQLPIDE